MDDIEDPDVIFFRRCGKEGSSLEFLNLSRRALEYRYLNYVILVDVAGSSRY